MGPHAGEYKKLLRARKYKEMILTQSLQEECSPTNQFQTFSHQKCMIINLWFFKTLNFGNLLLQQEETNTDNNRSITEIKQVITDHAKCYEGEEKVLKRSFNRGSNSH